MNDNELIAYVAQAGYHISARQLERWHKADLIPRPVVIPPRVFGEGNHSAYPDNCGPQVVAVCQLLFTRKHKLNPTRFWLWLEGYPIPLPVLKQTIRKLLPPLGWKFPRLVERRAEVAEEKAETIMQHFVKSTQRHVLRSSLQRFNQEDRSSLVILYTYLMYDYPCEFTSVDHHHAESSEEAMSSTELITQALQIQKIPFLSGDLTRDLNRMSSQKLLSLSQLNATLEDATTEKFECARQRLPLLGQLFEILEILSYLSDPLRRFAQKAQDSALLQALSLIFLMLLEDRGYGGNINIVFQTVQANLPILQRGQAIYLALREELPEVAQEMMPPRHAQQTSEVQKAYLDRLRNVYQRYKIALDTFWQCHPEWIIENDS